MRAAGGVSEQVRPMLATAGPMPGGPGWAFEFAWDGIRSLADVRPEGVRLVGRNDHSIGSGYPELDVLPALARGRRLLLDGKIVALDAFGRPDFSRLQQRMNVARPSARVQRRVPVAYYVFDLLRIDDRSTLQLPYRGRRELLEELGLTGEPIVLSPYFLDTDGQAVLDTAAQYGLHGVVAKHADSTYQPGRRSRSWVQTVLRKTQEVIVGGWVPSRRGRVDTLGALLVGVPTEQGLAFAGQVGTGFTDAMRRELRDALTDLARPVTPFVDPVPLESARAAHWVVPELLGEVSYRRWTRNGRLGNPTWGGLRPGKHPAAVHAPVVLRTAVDDALVEPAELAELDEQVRRARAELDSLRARMSSHFLYNALSTIAALVRTDPKRARELLIDFADFTRYSFRSGTGSTVVEEFDNVERYLTLEQARLGDRLRVELHVAPETLPTVLPFLAVQPLVERAVRHGIEDEPLGGVVTVSAVAAGADCLITVADDGPGTSRPEAQAAVRDVEDRLRAAFGADYRLVVDGTPGAGTTITVQIPSRAAP